MGPERRRREARRKIEGCEVNWSGWENSQCIFVADVEISIDQDFQFAQGIQPKLIVVEIRE